MGIRKKMVDGHLLSSFPLSSKIFLKIPSKIQQNFNNHLKINPSI